MNFSCDSVKAKTKLHNEDFFFDIQTPRGHFFAVLDFTSHDYANLNAALKGKLESIVGSFASLDDFSDDLFLGFLAKEINNFVSNLADQTGGPDLLFSAALCLVSGNNLAYFLSGNVAVDILNSDGLKPLKAGIAAGQLGARNLEVPPREGIARLSLHDADLVLITTQGLAEVLPAAITNLRQSDPKSVCDSLMKAGATGGEDRTIVVIGGPYGQRANAVLADSAALAELKNSVASLAARFDAMTESEQLKQAPNGRLEGSDAAKSERDGQELDTLKDELRGKAASIDLLELEEKVEVLSGFLASKADTADLLGLQRDVLKLNLSSKPLESTDANITTDDIPSPASEQPATKPRSFSFRGALLVILLSLAAGFAGSWLQSRAMKKSSEVWTVKSSGNQVVISRLDGSVGQAVTMNVAEPVKSSGEQTFSSFADVKRYLDTITSIAPSPGQTSEGNHSTSRTDSTPTEIVQEIEFKTGDTLKKLAKTYKVPPRKLIELNPTITRWSLLRAGHKIVVPAATPTPVPSLAPQTRQSPASQFPANTAEVTVGPGDSLHELARRFNTTPEKLKELNPDMNWPRIHTGQKVIVPLSGRG